MSHRYLVLHKQLLPVCCQTERKNSTSQSRPLLSQMCLYIMRLSYFQPDPFTYRYSLALCPYVNNFFCVPMSPVSYLYLTSYFLNLWHNTRPRKSSELNTAMQFLRHCVSITKKSHLMLLW